MSTTQELVEIRELRANSEDSFVNDETVTNCGYCGSEKCNCVELFNKRRVIFAGQSKPAKW